VEQRISDMALRCAVKLPLEAALSCSQQGLASQLITTDTGDTAFQHLQVAELHFLRCQPLLGC
jgi:hypothetical protein